MKTKRVLIFGYGKSGQAVERVLKMQSVSYVIFDRAFRHKKYPFLRHLPVWKINQFSQIILSPGVSIFHSFLSKAKKQGISVISELEFGFLNTQVPIVAVTGTNGKTTTVSLLTHIFNHAGINAKSFGNIGNPLSNIVGQPCDVAIVEVSSFQLEAVEQFKPKIGVLLNIAPNHLDRHKTMENYTQCKFNLFKNMDENSLAILNLDDPLIASHQFQTSVRVLGLSTQQRNCDYYYENNAIYIKQNKEPFVSFEPNEIHTYSMNLLAVCAVCHAWGIEAKTIQSAIASFLWLPSRLEIVDTVGGVTYINDSKATSIHACLAALSTTTKPVTLLVGGQNKGLHFEQLFDALPKHVEQIILFGQAKKEIFQVGKQYQVPQYLVKNLTQAVGLASIISKPDSVVLLSPCCTSFDAYNSYAERGVHFVKLVQSLQKKDCSKLNRDNNKKMKFEQPKKMSFSRCFIRANFKKTDIAQVKKMRHKKPANTPKKPE